MIKIHISIKAASADASHVRLLPIRETCAELVKGRVTNPLQPKCINDVERERERETEGERISPCC